MTKKLFFEAIGKFLLGAAAVGLLIFLPAGTVQIWQAWLLMGILFVPMFCAGLVMMARSPALLRKRLKAREGQKEQRAVIRLSGLLFALGFAAAGLSFRLGWPILPGWVSWAGAALFLLSYLLYGEVLRENAYLSRVVEVQQGQKVIDTGLYALVRHPMYSATILLFLSMPLVLGCPVSLALFLFYPALLLRRIRQEEALLERELKGYREYQQKVPYRLIPFLW